MANAPETVANVDNQIGPQLSGRDSNWGREASLITCTSRKSLMDILTDYSHFFYTYDKQYCFSISYREIIETSA